MISYQFRCIGDQRVVYITESSQPQSSALHDGMTISLLHVQLSWGVQNLVLPLVEILHYRCPGRSYYKVMQVCYNYRLQCCHGYIASLIPRPLLPPIHSDSSLIPRIFSFQYLIPCNGHGLVPRPIFGFL